LSPSTFAASHYRHLEVEGFFSPDFTEGRRDPNAAEAIAKGRRQERAGRHSEREYNPSKV